MNLYDRLAATVAALPDDASVTLSVGWLREELEAEGCQDASNGPIADLTCEELATELGRATSTVRAWLVRGDIPEAYHLNGREWRIPRAAVRRYLDAQRTETADGDDDSPALQSHYRRGAWRRHYRKAAQ